MRTQFLKKLSALFCLGLALLGVNYRAAGQLQVGPAGLPAQTFDALPPVSDWATLSVGPRVGGGVISSGTQMDTVVQTNPASTINLVLPTSSIASNAPSGFAQWNSVNHNLQTRADTNWYAALKATLRNNTGSNVVSLTVSYDLATAAGTGTISEQVPAHRVYYSLTGATGTWVHIPEFDSSTAIDNSSKSASLNLGIWAPNALLYFLWADVNASGANTAEGGYLIDNFAVKAVPPQPGPPTITAQPQSQTVNFPNQVMFSVNVNGSVPLFYQWLKDGTPINGATGSSYIINNATVNDQGSYSVVVTNSLGTATSSGATLAVNCSGATVPVSISGQPADQSLASGGTINLSVTASGTAPLVYQWYRNGSVLAGATAATYTKAGAQGSDSGLYTVVVKNCAGPVTSRSALVSISDPGYVLMGLTTYTWKYNQGTDLGTAWRDPAYNDAAWPSGRGLFAFEDNAALVPLINTTTDNGPSGNDLPTHYYRTTFTLSNDPGSITMLASNYFDDGAVVYVNGVEAFRYNMPAGAVQYGTLALAANPAGEGTFIISNIPSSLLRLGANSIAAEIHQNSLASSDNDFGMALIVNPVAPGVLAITAQPQSLAVEETKPATFTVGVQGAPAYYQWYKDGVAIPNATSNPFTIPVASSTDAGSYYVVVSNAINSVTSAAATLTVLGDTNAPIILEADGTSATTNVLVSFSELVLPSTATNIANYKITNTLGGTLTISSAVLQNGTNVLLRTSAPRVAGSNYILIVNNVRDVSSRQNVILPNSMFPIRTLISLIAFTSPWRFIDPFPPFDVDPGSLGSGWKQFAYDTSAWSDGQGVFWVADDPSVVSGPLGTQLSETPELTSYFRNTFQFRASPSGLQFFLTHLIDDGAVFYLNGSEIYRFNMPEGQVITSTPPAAVVGNVTRVGPIVLPISTIMQGSNVLAAELHQPQAADADKIFGVQLDASVQSFVVGPVVITGGPRDVVVPEGRPATFSVEQVGGSIFQWQTNGNNVTGATNATYTIPFPTLSMNGVQVRVVVNNSTSGATSSNATLRVIGDTNSPALVGAVLTTNGTVVVSFSEQMGASAAVASNYRITNSSGANIPITGAALAGGNSNVVLTVGSLPANTYSVVVSNVQDRATVANTISPNPSAARIGFDGPLQFLSLASVWKYEQSGTDLGTTWRNVGYNDSAWPSGPGMFGLEDGGTAAPIMTPLALANNGVATITYYFRTTVNSPAGGTARLRLRMELDDSAVFYLNGVEFMRVRIDPSVNVVYGTFGANPPTEGVFETFDAVVTNLVGGANLFAVEVHQSSAGSSDVVFGTDVTLLGVDSTVIQPPVQIVTQPQSQTASTGSTVSFDVVATGAGPLFYQWLKGGVDIPNATSSTYTITNVQASHAGGYSVRVTNSFSSATSSVATLTVGGGTCAVINWTNNLRFLADGTNAVTVTRNGNVTTTVLSWTNPVTNAAPCNSNAVVVLQRALTLGNTFPVPSTVWTNIYTNVFGYARVTNSVTNNSQAYYRLRVP